MAVQKNIGKNTIGDNKKMELNLYMLDNIQALGELELIHIIILAEIS